MVPGVTEPAEALKEPEQELPRHGPATKPLKEPDTWSVYVVPGTYDVTARPVATSRTDTLCPLPLQLPWDGPPVQPLVYPAD